MATPATRLFRLTGTTGAPIEGEVRTGGGARPTVVICHGPDPFEDWEFHRVMDATVGWFARHLA